MKYELKSKCTKLPRKRAAEHKKSKSKSQRLAGKKVVFFFFGGENYKARNVVTDPRKGYWT